MKKLFTILLISALTINTNFAQPGEGTWLLGGTTELSDTAWSQVVLTPSVGYFISDQMALGLGFSLNSTTNETIVDYFNTTTGNMSDFTITNVQSNMAIAPWMRYYLNEMFFINATLAIGSGSDKDKTENKEQTGWQDSDGNLVSEKVDKEASLGLNVGVGASILWGDHLAFEPMFGLTYSSSSNTNFDEDKVSGPSSINVGFKIGVCLMLGE